MGHTHQLAPPFNYLFCPPASGNHYNQPGVLGPIQPRVYKPDDKVGPPNWVHNLEHGGMVVLYRNDSPGATAAGLAAFQQYFSKFPPSAVCKIPAGALSPVIARFDDMPHPYAALVWDRVFYMDTWDPDLVNRFYLEESERLDANGELVAPPEQQCAAPSPSVAPGAGTDTSAAPSAASIRARRRPPPARSRRRRRADRALAGRGRLRHTPGMRALVKTAAGPGLELTDVPEPPMGIDDVRIARPQDRDLRHGPPHRVVGRRGPRGRSSRRSSSVTSSSARSLEVGSNVPTSRPATSSAARATSSAAGAATAGPAAATSARTPSASASTATARSPSRSSCR